MSADAQGLLLSMGFTDTGIRETSVGSLLEPAGRPDLIVELRRALQVLEAYETHGQTMSAVTRSMLESDEAHRLVFSHELDPMSLFDPATGQLLDVNDSWVGLYGYSAMRPSP